MITTLTTKISGKKIHVTPVVKTASQPREEPKRVKVGMRLASSIILLKFQTS